MNACDNIRRPSQELDVARYLLYNWKFAGVLYRFVSKRVTSPESLESVEIICPMFARIPQSVLPLTASLASYRLSVYRDLSALRSCKPIYSHSPKRLIGW